MEDQRHLSALLCLRDAFLVVNPPQMAQIVEDPRLPRDALQLSAPHGVMRKWKEKELASG